MHTVHDNAHTAGRREQSTAHAYLVRSVAQNHVDVASDLLVFLPWLQRKPPVNEFVLAERAERNGKLAPVVQTQVGGRRTQSDTQSIEKRTPNMVACQRT